MFSFSTCFTNFNSCKSFYKIWFSDNFAKFISSTIYRAGQQTIATNHLGDQNFEKLEKLEKLSNNFTVAVMQTVIGFVIFFLATLGCIGAFKEKEGFLKLVFFNKL